MGIKFCVKESECECKNYNEYEIKIKCMKTKLHSRYIASIAAGLVVWSLATGEANNAEFSSWISFASTITSIILSVIAIFMSISGENKTDSMRDKIEEAAKKLEKTAADIETANQDSVKNITQLRAEMNELKSALDNIPNMTVEKMQAVYEISSVDSKNTQNTSKGWLNKNEK